MQTLWAWDLQHVAGKQMSVNVQSAEFMNVDSARQ